MFNFEGKCFNIIVALFTRGFMQYTNDYAKNKNTNTNQYFVSLTVGIKLNVTVMQQTCINWQQWKMFTSSQEDHLCDSLNSPLP